jgi:hypothetical protein
MIDHNVDGTMFALTGKTMWWMELLTVLKISSMIPSTKTFIVKFIHYLNEKASLAMQACVCISEKSRKISVKDIRIQDKISSTSLIPDLEIMAVDDGETTQWVHSDSERESDLSREVGNAIQLNLKETESLLSFS